MNTLSKSYKPIKRNIIENNKRRIYNEWLQEQVTTLFIKVLISWFNFKHITVNHISTEDNSAQLKILNLFHWVFNWKLLHGDGMNYINNAENILMNFDLEIILNNRFVGQ